MKGYEIGTAGGDSFTCYVGIRALQVAPLKEARNRSWRNAKEMPVSREWANVVVPEGCAMHPGSRDDACEGKYLFLPGTYRVRISFVGDLYNRNEIEVEELEEKNGVWVPFEKVTR
jgi:hypothetical protein